jgi:hypothetical protein
MGGRYIKQPPLFDSKRVKKSKRNREAQVLCDIINQNCKGMHKDIIAQASIIQLKLSGGVKPECAPYEVSDSEILLLERLAFMTS